MQPLSVQSDSIFTGLIHAFQLGGFIMYPILFCMISAITIIIERVMRLYFRYPSNGESFMYQIERFVLDNNIDEAIRACNSTTEAVLPKVLKAGLQRASRDDQQIQNALDASTLDTLPKLEKNLTYLALIANVSTLLGLLGTISGLIKAFAAVAKADPAQRQEFLARGISEAMNATAFGLLTAILAMVAHSVLSTKAQKIIEEMDAFSVKLMDLLSARRYRHSAEKGSSN